MKKIKEKKSSRIFIFFLLFISLFLLYARYVEPNKLIIKEYKIENKTLPDSFDGLKIIHFSDLHYGSTVDYKYLTKVVNIINEQKPDIIFFTGDLIDKDCNLTDKQLNKITQELNKLKSTLGNYIVTGNHDIKHLEKYKEIIKDNFILLDNEEKLLYYKESTPISIVGLSDASETKVNYDVLKNDNTLFRFVLAHEPDEYKKISEYSFNILLSGHSHNGQIRLPFIGAVYTPVGAKTYYEQYYKLDNKEIYVSNGIGTSKIELRFLSTPSINLYRLYAH